MLPLRISNVDIHCTYHYILKGYCEKITLVEETLILKIERKHPEHFKFMIKLQDKTGDFLDSHWNTANNKQQLKKDHIKKKSIYPKSYQI